MGSVAIHQPNYLPRLKVLQKLAFSDIWVVLSNVQYSQREWQNRAKILPHHNKGNSFWLTLPVNLLDGRKTHIGSIEVRDVKKEMIRCSGSIRHAFRSAPYWHEVEDFWKEVTSNISSGKLVDLVMPTMVIALRRYARVPEMIDAVNLKADGKGSALMANICDAIDCQTYLADSGSKNYLRVDDFRANVVWQKWREPFQCNMHMPWRDVSFISFLAFYGPDALNQHLMNGTFERNSMALACVQEGENG